MDKVFLKGLSLIETLVLSEEPRGITELATELGLNKSNVHRLPQTLVHCGYVTQEASSGRYTCSLKLWQLGSVLGNRIDVKQIARPYLIDLAKRSAETVHLSVLDGGDVVYIDKINSSHPIGTYTVIGGRAPAYAVSTGKVLLSILPDQEVQKLCPTFERYTEWTVVTAEQLKIELEKIRRQGYAVNRGEWNAGVGGVAAPVYDASSRTCAAIGMSGPLDRLTPKVIREMTPHVLEAAANISIAMGYADPALGIQKKSQATAEALRTAPAPRERANGNVRV